MKLQNFKSFADVAVLLTVLAIQSLCCYNIFFERFKNENFQMDFRALGLFIYLFSIWGFFAVRKFLLSNVLWTIGLCLLFEGGLTAIAGALLIGLAVWHFEKVRNNP